MFEKKEEIIPILVDPFLYRTVAWNLETLFEENSEYPFPKYLTSFRIGTELELPARNDIKKDDEEDESNDKDELGKNEANDKVYLVKGIRIIHANTNRSEICPLPFHGLSLHRTIPFHNGIYVSGFKDVVDEIKTNQTGTFYVPWSYDETERTKAMKKFGREVNKLHYSDNVWVYGCYRYDTRKMNKHCFCAHFHDDDSCKISKDSDQVTIYPEVEEFDGELVTIMKKPYLYSQELLSTGWTPCCICVRCETEPNDFSESYDVDCWWGCKIIFTYIHYVPDYSEADALFTLLELMKSNNYIAAGLREVDSNFILEVSGSIHDLIGHVLEYPEADGLIKFTNIINQVVHERDQSKQVNVT